MKGLIKIVEPWPTRKDHFHYRASLPNSSEMNFIAPGGLSANDLKPYMLEEQKKAFGGISDPSRFGLDSMFEKNRLAIEEGVFEFGEWDPHERNRQWESEGFPYSAAIEGENGYE